MEVLQLFLTMIVIILGISTLAYLNKKYDLGLNEVSSCNGFNDGNARELSHLLHIKEQEIGSLKERVQVLEKLVTDPKEHLKREIDAL
jgi:hypothetical protein